MTKSRGIRPPRHYWTDSEIEQIERLYPDTPTAEIARQLGMTTSRVSFKAARLGLKKSAAYLESPAACRIRKGDTVGAATRFYPGHTTWNKGLHGLDIGGKETQFKPGYRSGKALLLYQPIGTERVSKDGYLERKINDDMPFHKRWRGVHIINWEAINGPLPKGYALVFRDGNKQNTAVENLVLLSRSELMRRNSYHTNYPKEVAQLVQLRGAITRQIKKRSKE